MVRKSCTLLSVYITTSTKIGATRFEEASDSLPQEDSCRRTEGCKLKIDLLFVGFSVWCSVGVGAADLRCDNTF